MNITYTNLNQKEQKFYKKYVELIKLGKDSIRFNGILSLEQVNKITDAVENDYPEFFYISKKYYYQYDSYVELKVVYTMEKEVREVWIKKIDVWVKKVHAQLQIREDISSLEICKRIHDLLVEKVEYDKEAYEKDGIHPEAYNILGVYEKKKAVCSGIAKAFQLLAKRAGVEVYYIGGSAQKSDGLGNGPHAWNVVKINGEYVHVDVTWDLGKMYDSIRYDYFMIPDSWISKDHTFDISMKCSTSKYSFFKRTNCLIGGMKLLEEYINFQLQQKNEKIYFKAIGKNKEDDKKIQEKVEKIVSKIANQNAENLYAMEHFKNIEQNIFFYKLKYR